MTTLIGIDQRVLFQVEFLDTGEPPKLDDVIVELQVVEALVTCALVADVEWAIFASERSGSPVAKTSVARLGQLHRLGATRVNRLSLASPLLSELALWTTTIGALGSTTIGIGLGVTRLMRSIVKTRRELREDRLASISDQEKIFRAQLRLDTLKRKQAEREIDRLDSRNRLARGLLDTRPRGNLVTRSDETEVSTKIQEMEAIGAASPAATDERAGSEVLRLARAAPDLVTDWQVSD